MVTARDHHGYGSALPRHEEQRVEDAGERPARSEVDLLVLERPRAWHGDFGGGGRRLDQVAEADAHVGRLGAVQAHELEGPPGPVQQRVERDLEGGVVADVDIARDGRQLRRVDPEVLPHPLAEGALLGGRLRHRGVQEALERRAEGSGRERGVAFH